MEQNPLCHNFFPVHPLQGVQQEVCEPRPAGDPPEEVPRRRAQAVQEAARRTGGEAGGHEPPGVRAVRTQVQGAGRFYIACANLKLVI